MGKDWEEKAIIHDLRQAQRHSEQIARFCNTPAGRRRALKLSKIAEDRIIGKIERIGYEVHRTTYNAPFDAWVAGCKIEFKASNWQNKAQRYQANIRHHNADMIIFDAINGSDHYFIIPMQAVKPRQSVEIYSYDVNRYAGQWSPYLEAWDVLDQAIKDTSHKPIQLTFLDTAQLAQAAPERDCPNGT